MFLKVMEKEKQSAALGVAVRMLLLSKKVIWISWYKERLGKRGDEFNEVFANNLKMFWMGKGFSGGL